MLAGSEFWGQQTDYATQHTLNGTVFIACCGTHQLTNLVNQTFCLGVAAVVLDVADIGCEIVTQDR
jgi:hypothetical protein